MSVIVSARRHLSIALGVTACGLSMAVGCAQPKPVASPKTAHAAPPPAAKPVANADSGGAGIAAVASQVQMTFNDPKTGKTLWKAKVGSLEARNPSDSSDDVVGTLHHVDGILYESGTPANRMISPTVNIDNVNKTVIATGGVHVISLTQTDTDLRCDRVIWNAATNQLIGVGHVIMHKETFVQTGPSFAADTRLKSVVMPAPSQATGESSRKVHVQFR